MYLATQCTDARWPQSQGKLNRDSRRLDRKYDYFTWANAWFNGPCAYWHYPAQHPVHVTGKHVHVPVLMIDETFDPATPYEGSLYVRKIFPTASLDRGQERDDARRFAVRGRVHRRRDRALPGARHRAAPPGRQPLGQGLPAGAEAEPDGDGAEHAWRARSCARRSAAVSSTDGGPTEKGTRSPRAGAGAVRSPGTGRGRPRPRRSPGRCSSRACSGWGRGSACRTTARPASCTAPGTISSSPRRTACWTAPAPRRVRAGLPRRRLAVRRLGGAPRVRRPGLADEPGSAARRRHPAGGAARRTTRSRTSPARACSARAGARTPRSPSTATWPARAARPITLHQPPSTTRAGSPASTARGYADGVSGGPWLQRRATVVGVIGGLHQGGCSPATSYTSAFGRRGACSAAAPRRRGGRSRGRPLPIPGSDGC